MDISSSMLIGEDILRIDLAKQAAAAVIKTLSETDFVGLVTYNMQAAKFSSVLQAYGSSVKSSLDEFLGKIVASGRTNITLGFQSVFEVLNSSKAQGVGCNCTNIIILLTDGQPYDPDTESN